MSKYTHYVIEAQDLNITQAAVYNALKDRVYKDTSICWPCRKEISAISKVKKLQTISNTISDLEEKKHVIRLGEIVKNNETKCKMYWVNNGHNNVIQDVNHFLKELATGTGSAFMVEEMKACLMSFLQSYPQEHRGVVPGKDTTPYPEKVPGSTRKGYQVVPGKGAGNINITPNESQKSVANKQQPKQTFFDQLSKPDQELLLSNSPSQWAIDGTDEFVAEAWVKTPKEDAKAYCLKKTIVSFVRTLKSLKPYLNASNRKNVLQAYLSHLEGHLYFKQHMEELNGLSTFNGIEDWFKNRAWEEGKADALQLKTVQEWQQCKKQSKPSQEKLSEQDLARKRWMAMTEAEREAEREACRRQAAIRYQQEKAAEGKAQAHLNRGNGVRNVNVMLSQF